MDAKVTWHGWWIFPRVLDLANMWWRFPKERYSANKTTVLSWNFGNKKNETDYFDDNFDLWSSTNGWLYQGEEMRTDRYLVHPLRTVSMLCLFFSFLADWNLFDTSRGGAKTFYWPWLKPPVLRAQLPSGPDDHECEPGGRAKYSLGQDRKQVRNRSVKMRNRSVQCWLTRFLRKVDRIVTLNREIKMRLSENYMSILQNKLGQRSWSGAEVHRVRRPGSHSWRGKLSRPRRRHRRYCPSRPGYHW